MTTSMRVLCLLLCACCPAAAQNWQQQRDDLREYQLDQTLTVRSESECALRAGSQHHAALFTPTDGSCRLYICQLGWSGCRKCRNAGNSTLPRLLVRTLDQLGRSCWRTFQHRVDGSVNFQRNWTDYVAGFGQGEDGNYWMGLEAIHQLTQDGDRRVRWELSLWNGSWWWWEHASFAVQGAAQGYRVSVGSQEIDRSNVVESTLSNTVMNNQMFSTQDRDQDSAGISCAVALRSGWWHNACYAFNPNGQYYTPPTALSLTGPLYATGLGFVSASGAYPFTGSYSMATVECLVTEFTPDN